MRHTFLLITLALLMGFMGDVFAENEIACPANSLLNTATISGELRKWHKITLTFDGPNTSESANPNPFTDYRLLVTFTNGTKSYVVHGFYAADGNAKESSAVAGNKWQVHFSPDEIGTWNYSVSFRTGIDVAINPSANAGLSAGFCDGETGSFNVLASNKIGKDHRGKGRLSYVGEHYLQFQETQEYFIKMGADAPENTLAYEDFDDVPNRGNRRKDWNPHAGDYSASDAAAYTWKNGKGSELLGAIKYLSDVGANVFSFLTLSLHGDDENVFPYLLKVDVNTYNGYNDGQQWSQGVYHDRFDVSRLEQWEKVFEYADKKGMFLHFKTLETENDNIMDGNDFDRERKIYYRELVARFGHHLALNWNLSEEITLTEELINSTADWIKEIDPYDHLVVFHTYPGQKYRYDSHLGNGYGIDGASLQTNAVETSNIRGDILEWIDKSAAAGKKWVIGLDEPGSANIGIHHDPNDQKIVRNRVVWNSLMAGGSGAEFYYGYQTNCTDLNCEDHRSRELKYIDASYALDFFNTYLPFHEMKADDGITSDNNDYVFAKAGEVYVVYRPNGGTTNIDLPAGAWQVQWYNPRTGSMTNDSSAIDNQLSAPDNEDWVGLITQNEPNCEVGLACDDGDPCTVEDALNFNCDCVGTTLSSEEETIILYPIDDAYIQGTALNNNNILRIEKDYRTTYLKFDLSSISAEIIEIELELTVDNDPGNGLLEIKKGSHNNWGENNMTATNAPIPTDLLGSFIGAYAIQSTYKTTLTNIDEDALVSFVVNQENGNDVSFKSKETVNSAHRPKLIIKTNAGFNEVACDDGNACTLFDSVDENCECLGKIPLNVRVFLQGAMNNSVSPIILMDDDLRAKGLLPLEEPYSEILGYSNIADNEKEVSNSAVFNTTGNDAIVDWVAIELRAKNDASQVLKTHIGLLQRDGDVVSVDGVNPIYTKAEGEYFVAIRHRNHLGAMTELVQDFSACSINVDFTNSSQAIYGNNAMNLWQANTMALWGGNINADDKIIFQGNSEDLSDLFFDVLSDDGNNNFISNYVIDGYYLSDVNLDGKGIYQGLDNDPSFIFFNILLFPINTNSNTNYIIIEQLP